MFLGSLVVGYVPLVLRLSENRLRLVTVFGSGLLLGTALLVILPEGIDTLYRANALANPPSPADSHAEVSSGGHHWIGIALVLGFAWMFLMEASVTLYTNTLHHHHHHHSHTSSISGSEPCVDCHSHDNSIDTTPLCAGGNHSTVTISDNRSGLPCSEEVLASASPSSLHSANQIVMQEIPAPLRTNTSLDSDPPGDESLTEYAGDSRGYQSGSSRQSKPCIRINNQTHGIFQGIFSTTTVGMLVHAAADGVAMGATSASEAVDTHSDEPGHGMSWIIFVAILLHKAPEAFGLCTQLIQEGKSRKVIKQSLGLLSLAAPVVALGTYGLVQIMNWFMSVDIADQQSRMMWFTAVLLLFSAGTFLYVATVHSLPESMDTLPESLLTPHHTHHTPAEEVEPYDVHGSSGSIGLPRVAKQFIIVRLVALLLGMFLPALVALGHSH
ncbi:hypothetical protein IWQ62_003799 [Dispira parvispora]|uniref:Uncharacterized protein n=1 Tax=Dispira parvispora TaxID=1520584 RepID=A0A9W8ATJ6_9FUNG|nr:hypothetical protein IWQ62_003799 [Dispira parvispora]